MNEHSEGKLRILDAAPPIDPDRYVGVGDEDDEKEEVATPEEVQRYARQNPFDDEEVAVYARMSRQGWLEEHPGPPFKLGVVPSSPRNHRRWPTLSS